MPAKETMINLLMNWINKNPGLDPRDYGDWKNYRQEARRITNQLNDARIMLVSIRTSGMKKETLYNAFFESFSGRLTIGKNKSGEWELSYCTGQYFPTEYRASACAVMAGALWNYFREDIPAEIEHKGDYLRQQFKRIFGKALAERWLN